MDFWTIDFFIFFSPQTLGMAEVVFVERRNRFKGGVLGSFSIDFMRFWTIEFFSPPTLEVVAAGIFPLWPVT